MADNTQINVGAGGDVIASDDIGGVKYQRVKLACGADGSATDVTIGGGTEATALRVTLASDGTGLISVDDNGSSLSVDDGGGSLTVDGTVAISGTVTVAAHAVTNAGTFAVQESGAALTALQLIDNVVNVDDAAYTAGSGSGVPMMGFATSDQVNSGDVGAVRMTVSRDMCVNVRDSSGNTIDPQVDDAAFTAATSLVSVVAGFATTDSVDSSSWCAWHDD